MSKEIIYTTECLVGPFKPFEFHVYDDQGRLVWTIRERDAARRFFMTVFRLRTIFPLVLDMEGQGQHYVIRRPKGLWHYHYFIETPDLHVLWKLNCNLRGWKITDEYGQTVAEVTIHVQWFMEPFRTFMKGTGGEDIAKIEFTPRLFAWKGTGRGQIELAHSTRDWEVLATAVAALRVVHLQQR